MKYKHYIIISIIIIIIIIIIIVINNIIKKTVVFFSLKLEDNVRKFDKSKVLIICNYLQKKRKRREGGNQNDMSPWQ